jgi:urease accessory protein
MFGESANPMSAVSPHQRATGQLLIDLKRRGAETVLSDLRQQGCLKARFPRPVMWTEAITLNTSGGVAGGDVMNSTIRAQAGTKITVAAQAAARPAAGAAPTPRATRSPRPSARSLRVARAAVICRSTRTSRRTALRASARATRVT